MLFKVLMRTNAKKGRWIAYAIRGVGALSMTLIRDTGAGTWLIKSVLYPKTTH
jgi:hypothetical protein